MISVPSNAPIEPGLSGQHRDEHLEGQNAGLKLPLGRRWAVERNNQSPRSGNGVQAQQLALARIVLWLRSAYIGRANGSDVKLQAAHTRERTRGAPLAAMAHGVDVERLQAA